MLQTQLEKKILQKYLDRNMNNDEIEKLWIKRHKNEDKCIKKTYNYKTTNSLIYSTN